MSLTNPSMIRLPACLLIAASLAGCGVETVGTAATAAKAQAEAAQQGQQAQAAMEDKLNAAAQLEQQRLNEAVDNTVKP